MIFWILTAVAVVGILWAFVYWISEEGLFGVLPALAISLLSGAFWMLITVLGLQSGVARIVGPTHSEATTVQLRALGSDSSISGRSYFLGGGYIEGKRVLSYIRQNDDGSFTATQVDAAKSKIWEDGSATPTLTIHYWFADHWWLAPSAGPIDTSYEFRIPTGSVAETFEVKP